MPVQEIAVHHKVRKARFEAGCYQSEPPAPPPPDMALKSYRTFTGEVVVTDEIKGCCQIGRKFNGAWVPLDECLGCKAVKDEQYVEQARQRIDEETAKFMRADQRIV